MQIVEVENPSHEQLFVEMAVEIYKDDQNWIRPLDKDILDVFDKKKNKAFRWGSVIRWLFLDDTGKVVGRVAAFVNSKYKNKNDDVTVGGIGFFECVNDRATAFLILDTAKLWLSNHSMEAMDGPINFGERDRWWGMVTKGFIEPMYCMNYNPPHYVGFFEEYGFQPFFHQVCFDMLPKAPLDKKIWDRHAAVASDKLFSARHIRKNNLEKFANDFATIYNKAWAGHGGLKQMSADQVIILFNSMKPVMDERIIWFAYHDNSPIAMFVNLPDLNQWFKYLNGKFGIVQKLKFLLIKKFKPNKKFTGIVFGVVPEWQGKGVDAYIIAEAAKMVQSPQVPYSEYEMQWIGDFNPKMLNIAASLGDVRRSRQLTTYRYLFDRNKEFKRHPILS